MRGAGWSAVARLPDVTEKWTWQTSSGSDDAPGRDDASGSFPSQAEAEAWLSESWQELVTTGVDSVSLLCDGELVYGPMSLRAAQ